jgi:hypothetical protein
VELTSSDFRDRLWGQSFRFAAGLLPGVGMVQDFDPATK